MRRCALLPLLLLAAAVSSAEEDPPRPATPQAAADAVIAAAGDADPARVKALACLRHPDPWLVADELLARGRDELAGRYAEAGRCMATEALPAYVAARRGTSDATARAGLARMLAAGRARRWLEVLEGTEPLVGAGTAASIDSVVLVRLSLVRALALIYLGRLAEGAVSFERTARAAGRLGWRRGAAEACLRAGDVLRELGSFTRALEHSRVALKSYQALEDPARIVMVLSSLGNIERRLGRYSEAFAHFEAALATLGEKDRSPQRARVLSNRGLLQLETGDVADSIKSYREALGIFRNAGRKPLIATTLKGLAAAELVKGDAASAKANYEAALALFEEIEDHDGIASTHNELGTLALKHAQDELAALAHYQKALALFVDARDKPGQAATLNNIGTVHVRAARYEKAEDVFGRAEEILRASPSPAIEVRVMWSRWWVRYSQGRPKDAAWLARRAIQRVSALARGLADQEGAATRGVFGDLFELGVRASLAAGDEVMQTWMFEQGRASMLRAGLASRAALEAAVFPEAEAHRLEIARAEERLRSLDEKRRIARKRGRIDKQLFAAHTAATDELHDLADRFERKRKAEANLLVPDADGLLEIRSHLEPGEALVSYELTDGAAVALVVTRDGVRMRDLGPSQAILDAADGLEPDAPDARPQGEVDAAAEQLRALLVDPLALDAEVKRVLLSPDGRLAYLPFSLLFEEPELAYVPSGSTYGMLLPHREMTGEGIFALADPDYRTHLPRQYARLGESRDEIKAFANVTLMGGEATETNLPGALKKDEGRWRAVHFACHGQVDSERPRLSSLVLTKDARSDGYLTMLEILRMKIPSDLVVLSACNTGRGKIYKTEGIVGLTRAFMFAGAPRVICSLWKVDDEATSALMSRFYALWKGGRGLGTAAALKQAQLEIKSDPKHPKWRHPYYWAAWVLWGLPH